MYFKKIFSFVLFVCIFLSSCTDKNPVTPQTNQTKDGLFRVNNNYYGVTVLTRNIYVGTDVDVILQNDDPSQIPILVAQAFGTLLETNFPERAEALAREIKETQPHLVGLQEVSLIRLQSPGDAVVGGTIPAEEVFMDYLDILMQALGGMGLEYEVVAKVQNSDVEMPMITKFEEPYEFDDVRLTDFDVILAKKGININKIVEKNYRAKVVLTDLGIELPRGYVAVTAEINENKYRFVNTHLEDADQGGDLLKIQRAQAAELIADLAHEKLPVILVGDFNSAAPNEPTYKLISRHHYQDVWLINSNTENPGGLTYGHDADLRNPEQNFWKRIDFIFVKNKKQGRKHVRLMNVKAEVLGDEVKDKTLSGLWPSDHGGIAARLEFRTYKNH